MVLTLECQRVLDEDNPLNATLPSDTQLKKWVLMALGDKLGLTELVIRIVEVAESAELNDTYRNKKAPTNVLSFPFETPQGVTPLPLLGDLVICATVVTREAEEQHKTLHAHWAHMVIHGVLHLLGYDHIEDDDAAAMEKLEIELLASLGYSDPYIENGIQ
ncbi:MAG: rRNA maturation RNase YbeY [Gammaproteobacteria bacterium]|nr:rRNA maturation RNase YbeY [Gammaproteobacteria bacterium]MCF6229349.1 rRNA maturation RNase YbeY [Gammaproteobacteria bacterium]